jgi:hypothetical protein
VDSLHKRQEAEIVPISRNDSEKNAVAHDKRRGGQDRVAPSRQISLVES